MSLGGEQKYVGQRKTPTPLMSFLMAQHPRETAAFFALQLLGTYTQKDLSAIHDTSFYFPELTVASGIYSLVQDTSQ